MLDLVAIGNISADLYFDGHELTQKDKRFTLAIGGKYFVDKFLVKVGGGAANVAIGVRKNRLKSAVCAIVGNNPFRKTILHKLKQKKVSTKYVLFRQDYSNLSVILLNRDGERTIINYESPHQHLVEDAGFLKRMAQTRAVYFGNLPDVSLTQRKKTISNLKRNGAFIFANIGTRDCCKPKKYISELLEDIDVLILNGHEFSELVKKPYKKIDFKRNVLNNLKVLKDKIAVITEGENGSFGYRGKTVCYQKAIKPKKIVDATGAGDGYTAGFIAEYLKSQELSLAMKKGAQYASKILAKVGAN